MFPNQLYIGQITIRLDTEPWIERFFNGYLICRGPVNAVVLRTRGLEELPMASLKYNGTHILWIENGKVVDRFDATSGMRKFQTPSQQCVKDAGPIPEGVYVLRLRYNRQLIAVVADPVVCKLKAARGIQQIPDGDPKEGTEHCTPYWNSWGSNRVRIDAYDTKARRACHGKRDRFYIHDSAKGFSHGCIEVKHRFFTRLYRLVNSDPKSKSMLVDVDYSGTKTTLGRTK